jgi:hypothetical protein
MFGKKIAISDHLLYRRPLLLRQLKNKPESSEYNWSTFMAFLTTYFDEHFF